MSKRLAIALGILLSFSLGSAYAQADLQQIEQTLSDSVITAKITAKFTKNRILNPLKISVSTNNGVVTLSGHVKNQRAMIEALKLSKQTAGVKAVKTNHLIIQRVNTVFTDAYITAKVEAAILKAKVFDDESIPLIGINATTTNGTVTLTGRVKNRESISRLIKRVYTVNGVKKVISQIKINAKG